LFALVAAAVAAVLARAVPELELPPIVSASGAGDFASAVRCPAPASRTAATAFQPGSRDAQPFPALTAQSFALLIAMLKSDEF
jgi:hypothetical protein